MFRGLIVAAYVVIFCCNFASTVFAHNSQMLHTSDYLIDGRVDFKKQAGHLCNTGAEFLQVISGDGQLEKSMSLVMVEGKIELTDGNEFSTNIDAVKNLNVTTAIELCTPPKTHLDPDRGWIRTDIIYWWDEDPLLDDDLWLEYWEEVNDETWEFIGDGKPSEISPEWEGRYYESSWRSYQPREDLTKQIWAASVSADPGHSGILSNSFTAAYGTPMWSDYQDPEGRRFPAYLSDPELVDKNKWAYGPGGDYYIGPDYVGDYFLMDQYAHVTRGTLKRFIDISSPYSHALLHEDMTATGFADIEETFAIHNMISGENVSGEWWRMFDLDAIKTTSISSKDQYLSHNAKYALDGSIDLKKQAGHLCNSGGELKQLITGDGEVAKTMDVEMIEGLLVTDDTNEIKTALDAAKNLTAKSVIELCAPPKQVHDDSFVYLYEFGLNTPRWGTFNIGSGHGPSLHLYQPDEDELLFFGPYSDGHVVNPLLNPRGLSSATDISEQIWAVSIEANPGHVGVLDLSFEAAHGPYGGYVPDPSGKFKGSLFGEPYERQLPSDSWWISTDGRGIFPVAGSDYVGNYFTIDQVVKITDGTLKRYIDISSPWTHGYLHEDMSVSGMSEIKESFEMNNLPAGTKNGGRWWDLSDNGGYTIMDDYYLPGFTIDNFKGFYFEDGATVDRVIEQWLYSLLSNHEVYTYANEYYELHGELYSLYKNNKWSNVLDKIDEISDEFIDYEYNRQDAPNPDSLIKLPGFGVAIDFPWPVYGGNGQWHDLFQ